MVRWLALRRLAVCSWQVCLCVYTRVWTDRQTRLRAKLCVCVAAYCNSLQSVVPADAAALGLIPGQLQTDLRPHLLTMMTDVSGDVLRLRRFQCRAAFVRPHWIFATLVLYSHQTCMKMGFLPSLGSSRCRCSCVALNCHPCNRSASEWFHWACKEKE